MRRLLPSSLLGQVMLSAALALLVAQATSVVLLVRATEERRENAAVTTLAFRLINGAQRAERRASDAPTQAEERERAREQRRRIRKVAGSMSDPIAQETARDRLPPRLRYTVTRQPPGTAPSARANDHLAEELREVLLREGITPHKVMVHIRPAGEDPVLQRFAQLRPRLAAGRKWRERELFIASIQRSQTSDWESARLLAPARRNGALAIVLLPALITFAFLVVALFFVVRRITRPLAALTNRVEDFARDPDQVVTLAETGPDDTRRLIAAHNAMEARIAALLDEKDVMLGAIGHDLKTPLAALRVRIEGVDDTDQRAKMASSIEDITATLDDILMLARMGRKASLETEAVDLGALTSGVVEEFEDMGKPVTLISSQRLVARIQVTWVKRALRNLIDNALRYAGSASVSLVRGETHAILRVEDEGPGIAPDALAQMMEPFARGEASRNKATGGTGLGLTLARAIAEAHGGSVILANRSQDDPQTGGLRAEIRLPLSE